MYRRPGLNERLEENEEMLIKGEVQWLLNTEE
jgi:hypothetical protein